MSTPQEAKKNQYKHLAFYSHEKRRWERAVGRRLCLTAPVIALTLFAAYKKNPLLTIEGACVSGFGIHCINRANFYRRRAAYRVRQQQRSLEK